MNEFPMIHNSASVVNQSTYYVVMTRDFAGRQVPLATALTPDDAAQWVAKQIIKTLTDGTKSPCVMWVEPVAIIAPQPVGVEAVA